MAAGAKTNYTNGYQSSKCASLPKDVEIGLDLHLKMCKKIAQLTKVCFLLASSLSSSPHIFAIMMHNTA